MIRYFGIELGVEMLLLSLRRSFAGFQPSKIRPGAVTDLRSEIAEVARWHMQALHPLVCTIACLAVFFSGSFSAQASEEKRIALIVGNSSYKTVPLANPAKDARLMAKTLAFVGFEVTELIDADGPAMKKAVLEFGRALQGSDSVGVFYYAGHGVQVDGQNFLIPLKADIKSTQEVALTGINLNELLKTMARASSRLNIAILDACRDNPFAGNTRTLKRGLAPVRAPTGTFIAYATGPGDVAYDGDGDNSPYTFALSKALPVADIPIEEVFRRTRREVLSVTEKKQTPWEHSSLTGEFFFNPIATRPENSKNLASRLPGIGRETIRELVAWEKIKDAKDIAALEAHIKKYPEGVFTELAIVKLSRIKAAPTKTAWSSIVTGKITNRSPIELAEESYELGVKTESDAFDEISNVKAFGFYKQAAENGLPAAMFRLARMYDRGKGAPRDLEEAANWYKKAAEGGHVGAMASLGTLYEFGQGVEKNLVLALLNYRLAAEAGDRNAMTSLAYLYAQGKGVASDPGQARRWYGTAAELGQVRAMFNLALLLKSGKGGRKDRPTAVKWLKAAMEKGHSGAMRELAFLYDVGRGVVRSSGKAAELFLAALAAGDKQARDDVRLKRRHWTYWTKRQMQRQLTARGLYDGYVHGFMDGRTRIALEALAGQAIAKQ